MRVWAKITIDCEDGIKLVAERALIDPEEFKIEGPVAVASEFGLPYEHPVSGHHSLDLKAELHENESGEVYRIEKEGA